MKKRRTRFLPEYVSRYRDRHGKWRYRFRRKGGSSGHFRSEIGTDDWRKEYRAFMAAQANPVAAGERYGPGTVGALVPRFCSVPSRLGPSEARRKAVASILYRFRDEYGHDQASNFTFEHIDKVIERRTVKTTDADGRPSGGIFAARKLRKELRRLFAFALKTNMVTVNPVTDSQLVASPKGQKRSGYYSWTEADIARYRAFYPLGTSARLAMELLLWTGQRRIDGIGLGPGHIVDGRIEMDNQKTGKELGLPIAPQLVAAIVAMPPPRAGQSTYLVTSFGKPFRPAGFGNKMRVWCDAAGLPLCTAHGLRKAMMRRLAERGTSHEGIKSVSLHSGDEEVGVYTRAADQRRMARDAITAVSDWEALPPEEVDDVLATAAASALEQWKLSNPS